MGKIVRTPWPVEDGRERPYDPGGFASADDCPPPQRRRLRINTIEFQQSRGLTELALAGDYTGLDITPQACGHFRNGDKRMLKRYIAPTFFVALVIAIVVSVVWSSLDFQQCVKTNSQHQPSTQNLEESISAFIGAVPAYRHCVGFYVTDKNPVITAVGTVVIAIFTTILGIFTINLARSTRIAADAAQRAADVAARVELPVLAIKIFTLRKSTAANDFLQPMHEFPAELWPRIIFTNWGRSPAEIMTGCIEWTIVASAKDLPPVPKYKEIVRYAPGVVCVHRGDIPLDVPKKIELSVEQISQLNSSQSSLWVYGYIGFNDFLGDPHQSRFCGHWSRVREGHPGPFGFVWDDETPPEYTKRT